MNKQVPQIFDSKSSGLLFNEAKKLGLEPQWETDYGLFSVLLDPDSKKKEFFFHTNLNLNGSRARILAKNKQFTRIVLEQHNLPSIPYLLPRSYEQLEDFFIKHQPLICKPLLGDRSRQVYLIKSKKELKKRPLKMNIFEKYIKGVEYRCLVLNQQVIALQKKTLKNDLKNPWDLFYENLEENYWDNKLLKMSKKITEVMNLKLAGVDFIIDEQGNSWVLEVNSSPGITKIHQPDKGKSINAAQKIWQAVLENYRSSKSSSKI